MLFSLTCSGAVATVYSSSPSTSRAAALSVHVYRHPLVIGLAAILYTIGNHCGANFQEIPSLRTEFEGSAIMGGKCESLNFVLEVM